jgi:hypothetical protein
MQLFDAEARAPHFEKKIHLVGRILEKKFFSIVKKRGRACHVSAEPNLGSTILG